MFVCPVTGPLALVHSAMFGQDPMQQAGRAVGHGRSMGVLLQSQERSLLPSSTPRGLLPASAGPHKEETTSTKALFIPADPDSSTLRKKEGENGLCMSGCHYLRHGDTYQISSGLRHLHGVSFSLAWQANTPKCLFLHFDTSGSVFWKLVLENPYLKSAFYPFLAAQGHHL
ncbi:uncharacterized [Tachysurus ichikawai]